MEADPFSVDRVELIKGPASLIYGSDGMGAFRGSYLRAGEYSNQKDGFVFNSGSNEHAFDGKAGVNRRWGFVHLHFNSFDQKAGLISGERDSTGLFLKDDRRK